MSKNENNGPDSRLFGFAFPLTSSFFFVMAGAVTLVLGHLLSRTSPSLGLNQLGLTGDCAVKTGDVPQLASLHLYAVQLRWSALFLLMVLVSAVALVMAIAAVTSIWREANVPAHTSGARRDIIVLTAAVLVAIVVQFLMTAPPKLEAAGVQLSDRPAFLSYLMTTFTTTFGSNNPCQKVLSSIWSTKRIGESVGLIVGAAMTATATAIPDRTRLADRIAEARRLLYAVLSAPILDALTKSR
jgi:hypothetical protein